MSILYDEGQEAIATESRRILQARANQRRLLVLVEQVGEYDRTFWETAVEQGWTALAIPEAHGGLGLGLVELGIVASACGEATAGAPFLTSGYGAARTLLAAGDRELQEQLLPKLASGESVAALAFGEEGAVLPTAPTVRFDKTGLHGVKPAVTAGLAADFAIVWAQHEGRPALALAHLKDVKREAVQSFDNGRLFADLTFDATPAVLLLQGAEAWAAALDVLARMAVVTAHEQTGGAEALLYAARDYANTRRAFGQPIGGFQSVKHRIAELYALVQLARANCIHAASREGEADFLAAAAAARISATEAYDAAARDCIQIHGGIGVTWEAGLHLHQRRARSLALEQGGLLFWEDVLVNELTGVAA